MSRVPPQPAGLPSRSFGGRSRSVTAHWQWQRLLAAPHRLAFAGGSGLLAASALWWGAMLVARAAGVVLPWAVTPGLAHALLAVFGVPSLFMAGLVLSAGPRWLGLADLPGRLLRLPVMLMLGGWLVALAGFHVSAPLAALGVAAAAVGLALATGLFGLLVLESTTADRDHAVLALTGCALTVVTQWAAAVTLALGQDLATRALLQAALWAGVALVFTVLAHRAITGMTGREPAAASPWRARPLLGALALLLVLQAPLAGSEALADGALPALPAALRALLELLVAALLFWLSLRWGLRDSLVRAGAAARGRRLLAMLHVGFCWLAVAFTLAGVSHALTAWTGGEWALGPAPLHAFTMGFLGSLLLALATRLACSRSGRPPRADNWMWLLFWALQGAVLARVLASLWPRVGTPLTLLAAQFWLAAVAVWAWRHLPWFGRPRVDGGAG